MFLLIFAVYAARNAAIGFAQRSSSSGQGWRAGDIRDDDGVRQHGFVRCARLPTWPSRVAGSGSRRAAGAGSRIWRSCPAAHSPVCATSCISRWRSVDFFIQHLHGSQHRAGRRGGQHHDVRWWRPQSTCRSRWRTPGSVCVRGLCGRCRVRRPLKRGRGACAPPVIALASCRSQELPTSEEVTRRQQPWWNCPGPQPTSTMRAPSRAVRGPADRSPSLCSVPSTPDRYGDQSVAHATFATTPVSFGATAARTG